MALRIDGKMISAQIKDELKEKVAKLKEEGKTVTLAVIQVGNDPASTVYVGNKKKACAYIGIESKAYELPEETTEEARAKVSEMIGNAAEILTSESGLSADDLSTSYISASPEYQWKDDERILIGQKAVQTLEITLHDIDSIGPVYDRLMSLSGISISDVTLDKEDKSEEYRQARMDAVRDAYSKAEAFAQAAGVEVGSILSITDGTSYGTPLYRSANLMLASADAAYAEASPTVFYSGEITVSASVSIIYSIS